MTEPLLVTGAAGQLGRRVLEILLERGHPALIATTRNPDALAAFAARGVTVRRADFEDEAGLAGAFAGAGRALLISTDALDRPGRRRAQHLAAVRALAAAGVRHVVYTSLPEPHGSPVTIAPDHAATERALEASSLGFTVLRDNLYAELLLGSLPAAIASGQLIDARGDGAVAWVSRDDCARAAAGALLDGFGDRRTLEVSGPAAITSAELAAIASRISGKPVRRVSVTPDALIDGMVGHGVPRPIAELLASFEVAAARGQLARVTDTVARLGGQPARAVADVLAAHRAALTAPPA